MIIYTPYAPRKSDRHRTRGSFDGSVRWLAGSGTPVPVGGPVGEPVGEPVGGAGVRVRVKRKCVLMFMCVWRERERE